MGYNMPKFSMPGVQNFANAFANLGRLPTDSYITGAPNIVMPSGGSVGESYKQGMR
jgi:hypothetical protein